MPIKTMEDCVTDKERLDRLEKHCGIANETVSLGDWRGWKLTARHTVPTPDCIYVEAYKENHNALGMWRLGLPMPKGYNPEMVNALLTAYCRAVAKGLATWPEGWEWAAHGIQDWEKKNSVFKDIVHLGSLTEQSHLRCYWPIHENNTAYPESRRRAAALGLVDAQHDEVADLKAKLVRADREINHLRDIIREAAQRASI